ncbi:TetR/AcrR family transcriptional regulator [Jiangella mangrovi]|uniref:AcrR family transcriptional regulator n=1 Tax=Jiangella mangrovi TaxID=1524084 RepID=A0A7W9GXG7_9ACTN|nr:TetR/AcrR family transcriptional regulator [Jiangella mangrovi]MBB5791543.1 AcrR family transcriptional regulator [Jiangella mangrovi]
MTPPNSDRRSERARQAILRAAIELCRDPGFTDMTMEAIAKRAGVGKQTIYRWWPSKAAVVLDALHEQTQPSATFPDTGDVVADLRAQMYAVVSAMTSPAFVPYTALIAAAQSDPELARRVLDLIVAPRVAECRARLEKAQADGQVHDGADLGMAVELLYAPLYYRLLLHTAPPGRDQVDRVLTLLTTGLLTPQRP